eukprot:310090-Pleurochrysis_carterae.AAC.1
MRTRGALVLRSPSSRIDSLAMGPPPPSERPFRNHRSGRSSPRACACSQPPTDCSYIMSSLPAPAGW